MKKRIENIKKMGSGKMNRGTDGQNRPRIDIFPDLILSILNFWILLPDM
jgi:hypothetical protein